MNPLADVLDGTNAIAVFTGDLIRNIAYGLARKTGPDHSARA